VLGTYVNRGFEHFFRANVILNARAREYQVEAFPGPLSIKSVVSGEARWRVSARSYRVDRSSWLLTERGQEYDLSVRAPQPVETLVVFFADDFVADVASTRTRGLTQLLDNPQDREPDSLPIACRLWTGETAMQSLLATLGGVIRAERSGADVNHQDPGRLDEILRASLDACADLTLTARAQAARLAVVRPATRRELYRRLPRGKALLDDQFREEFDLHAAARAACLAPHHFHRSFRHAFAVTPYGYVVARRMDYARRLLAETAWPLQEIGVAAGYDSLASFARRFRETSGQTPGAYRLQQGQRRRRDNSQRRTNTAAAPHAG